MEFLPERDLQASPCRRGQGAQYERNFLAGKPRPVSGELHFFIGLIIFLRWLCLSNPWFNLTMRRILLLKKVLAPREARTEQFTVIVQDEKELLGFSHVAGIAMFSTSSA